MIHRAGRWTARRVVNAGTFNTKAEAIEAARELRAQIFTHHNEARHKDNP